MYSKGADETKKWILAVQKFVIKEAEENKDEEEKQKEEDNNDSASPFDILEKVRDEVNQELKDPDSNKEIEKILKKAANILKDYYEDDEEEDKDNLQQPVQPQQNVQPNPQQLNQDQSTGTNPTGGLGDLGAPGGDLGTAGGVNMNAGPMGGGQM